MSPCRDFEFAQSGFVTLGFGSQIPTDIPWLRDPYLRVQALSMVFSRFRILALGLQPPCKLIHPGSALALPVFMSGQPSSVTSG